MVHKAMDGFDTQTLVDALSAKNWYLLAATVIGLIVFAWRRLAPGLWEKIPNGYRLIPPIALAGLIGFLQAFQAGKTWKYALAQLVGCALWAGLLAMGGHGGLVELPIPYGGGAGGGAKDESPPG